MSLPELRRAEAMARLDEVLDPELDEPVTGMGFIESIAIEDGDIDVVFRLPTFWCSANFAFLMAVDMKAALDRLPWAGRVTVRLVDHFAARKINDGVAQGLPFQAVFGGDSDLSDIRRKFREKAYLGRQERLLRALVAARGVEPTLGLSVAGLRDLANDAEWRALALRYLTARLADGGSIEPDAPAFTTLDGEPVAAADYLTHLRAIRKVRGSAEANAELCRIQLDARYAGARPGEGTTLEGRRHAHG